MSIDSAEWFLKHHDGIEHGPYTLTVIVEAARIGNIANDSQVRHEKHTDGKWVLANRIRPIAEAMAAAQSVEPPPASPQLEFVAEQPDQVAEPTPEVRTETEGRSRRKRSLRLNVPATASAAALAMFDFRFRSFVTPWIIKIYWAIAVFTMSILLLFGLIGIMLKPLNSVGSASYSEKPNAGYRAFFSLPKKSFGGSSKFGERKSPRFISGAIDVLKELIALVFSVVTLLLFLRVFLELAIVVFRIAEDLSEVRRLTDEANHQLN